MNKKDLKNICFGNNGETIYMNDEVDYCMTTALAACDLLLEFTSPRLDQSVLSSDQINVVAKINECTLTYVKSMEMLQSRLNKVVKR